MNSKKLGSAIEIVDIYEELNIKISYWKVLCRKDLLFLEIYREDGFTEVWEWDDKSFREILKESLQPYQVSCVCGWRFIVKL